MDMRKDREAMLERRVLEALEGGMWTAPQLARELSIPRSRLDPLLRVLESRGLAECLWVGGVCFWGARLRWPRPEDPRVDDVPEVEPLKRDLEQVPFAEVTGLEEVGDRIALFVRCPHCGGEHVFYACALDAFYSLRGEPHALAVSCAPGRRVRPSLAPYKPSKRRAMDRKIWLYVGLAATFCIRRVKKIDDAVFDAVWRLARAFLAFDDALRLGDPLEISYFLADDPEAMERRISERMKVLHACCGIDVEAAWARLMWAGEVIIDPFRGLEPPPIQDPVLQDVLQEWERDPLRWRRVILEALDLAKKSRRTRDGPSGK
jgi:hypothetical protein